MKNKLCLILLFFIFSTEESKAQFEYKSRLLDEFNISRTKSDYYGIIKNGEELKSISVFQNNGIDSLLLLQINSFLAIAYNELRYYDRIKPLYEEIENYRFCYLDTLEINNYFSTLCSITQSLLQMHDLHLAKIVYEKCEALYNTKKIEERNYVGFVSNKISILYESGQEEKATDLTLEIIKKINNFDMTFGLYINIVSHYFDNNNLIEAESIINEALTLYKKQDSILKINNSLDPNYKSIFLNRYNIILTQLSRLYEFKSDYTGMLETSRKELQLSREYSMSPRYLALSMITMANTYFNYNKLDSAYALCKEALTTIENEYGNDSPELIGILDEYGLLLEENKPYESLKMYKRAIKILENLHEYYDGMESPFKNISRLYARNKFPDRNDDSSIAYSRRACFLIQKYFSESSEIYIDGLSQLAYSYSIIDKYDSSIYYHLKAKEIYEKNNYQESDLYNGEIFYLAIDYISNSQNNESKKYFNLWINYWRSFIKKNFFSLVNNIDKADKITEKFELYDYYAQRINDQEMLSISFENKIILKNLKLNHISELKRELKNNKSANDIYLKLSALYTSASNSEIDKNEEYELVSQLYNLIPIYKQVENSFSVKINDCKKKLKIGQAIIEFGKYNFNYSDDGKESEFYFALILSSNNDEIKYVPLGFEEDIKKIIDYFDGNMNSLYQYSYKGLYDLIVRPIVNNLKGINCIYVSSTGIINQFNLSALQSQSNRSLSESYTFFNISSTSDFLKTDNNQNSIKKVKEIYSYGGIDYGNSKNYNKNSQYINRSGINKWNYLPGTLSEINFIDSLFSKSNIKSIKLVDKSATESSIYNLQKNKNPYVLHIASHGFYLNPINQLGTSNPLDLSGLLFSQANYSWNQSKIAKNDSNDGILFGSELSNIDLSNCALSVLSACETGLGKIMNNEGVFGLQRALKLAGVQNCIVSLWKVQDQETSELFKLFYTNVYNGMNIHDSFYKAQIAMKEKYVLPLYWAGFILIE